MAEIRPPVLTSKLVQAVLKRSAHALKLILKALYVWYIDLYPCTLACMRYMEHVK